MIAISWGEPSRVPAAKPEPRESTIGEIIASVASKYGLTIMELKGDRRSRRVSVPRQEIMYRAYTETGASLPTIGRSLGDRDHSTVLFGIRSHEARNGLETNVLKSNQRFGAVKAEQK